jgi:hypothetical protein
MIIPYDAINYMTKAVGSDIVEWVGAQLCRADWPVWRRQKAIAPKGVFDMGQNTTARLLRCNLPCLISLLPLPAWLPRCKISSLSCLWPNANPSRFSRAKSWSSCSELPLGSCHLSHPLLVPCCGGRGRSSTAPVLPSRRLLGRAPTRPRSRQQWWWSGGGAPLHPRCAAAAAVSSSALVPAGVMAVVGEQSSPAPTVAVGPELPRTHDEVLAPPVMSPRPRSRRRPRRSTLAPVRSGGGRGELPRAHARGGGRGELPCARTGRRWPGRSSPMPTMVLTTAAGVFGEMPKRGRWW